eukprot:403338511
MKKQGNFSSKGKNLGIRFSKSLILCSLALFASMSYSLKSIDFKLGYYVDKAVIKENEHIYYNLIVGDDYRPGTDVIIKALPLDDDSDPDIFISKTNKFPNSSADSEWQCASYGRDTCAIHHSDVKKGDNFYIGIVCPRSVCNLQIISMTSDEFKLEDGVEFQTQLVQNEARIFKFKIPDQMNDDDHIIIKGSAFAGNAHDFILSVSTDIEDEKDLPSSNLDNRKSISAWKKGQVIRLNRDNFPNGQWCKGCELKILMDVVEAGYYKIMVRTTDAIPKIYNGDQIDDIVGFDEIQCYQYYVKSENTDFQVTLTTYTGRVEMKFNPGLIPESWEDMHGHNEEDSELILDIRPWLRSHKFNQSKGIYYVCVKGQITSTYTLKVKEFEIDWTHSVIEDSYAESFGMRPLSQQIHLYKVPELEYADEDIKIEFQLMARRGPVPELYAAFCTQNSTEECKQMATKENIQGPSSPFKKAIFNGQILTLVIDHDAKQCQDLFNGIECYYVVYIVNPEDTWCRYKLEVSHNQNNHLLLQERTPKIDSVPYHTYKYYKFTILDLDKSNITNVSFEINPLHGDADIIVARNITFPTRDEYEKKSTRVGSLVDHVSFFIDENTTSLSGTYYIAVWGYSYSTYQIIVNVDRKLLKGQKIDDNYLKAVTLYQGIPITKSLQSFRDRFYAQFSVVMDENESNNIVISLNMLEHNVKTYIKYGSLPTQDIKDMEFDGSFTHLIEPAHKNHHKNGTYYILVVPDPNFFDIFIDKTYSFSLSWRTFDKIPHLNSQGLQQVKTGFNSYSVFQHYVLDNTQDIRISLITQGHQDIFVSANPNVKDPKNETADFSTKYQRGGNYTKGKTLIIPMDLIIQKNDACKDLGYAENNKCVLYVSVYCQDTKGCSSQIELEYDTQQPRRIYSGQSKHTIMSNESFGLYYISVNQKETSDVFAVLQTMTGEAYIEYSLQRFGDDYNYTPTKNRSVSKLNTQTLKIKNSELKKCFENQPEAQAEKQDECQVVFKIIPEQNNKEENLIYNFAAYIHIIEVSNKQAIYGSVDQGEYQYFLYRENCLNCTMLISLTGQSNDALDLVINKGTTLPSVKDHHIRSPKNAQLVTVNLKNTTYFKQNRIDSMEGNYVIGVYGLRDTTFLLTITSEDEPIITLGNGVPIKHSQTAGEMIYYQYYHWSPNDIEISLQVSSGEADLLVSKYLPSEDEFISKLPSNFKKSLWTVENINSTNVVGSGKEIVVLQNDRDFCVDCYYLIGVKTDDESNAMYSLEIKSINARVSYQNLLRVGDNKMIKLAAKEQKIYQFMLESDDHASIVPTVINGEVRYYLGFSEEYTKAFHTQSNNLPIKIEEVSPDQVIHPDKNYYLIIEAQETAAELSLNLQQKMTYINLYDGVPQTIFFHNRDDAVKNLQFNMPAGNFTVMITVKSKTKNFYPQTFIYVDKKEDLQNVAGPKFTLPLAWDRDQYVCQGARRYTNMPDGAQMNVVLKYNMFKDKLNSSSTNAFSKCRLIWYCDCYITYSQVINFQMERNTSASYMKKSYSFHYVF